MKRKTNHLAVESLETRDNPAVGVMVTAGDLYVTGDAGNDQVQIQRLANNLIRVQGVNGTRVNGVAFVDRALTDDLYVNLGTGNNYLKVLDGNGGVVADFVELLTAGGADTVSIDRLRVLDDLSIDTGEGNDTVFLNQVSTSGTTTSYFATGITVHTGGGADTVRLFNSTTAEDISVILDPSESTGLGYDDYLYMNNVRAAETFNLQGRGGRDTIDLNNSTAGGELNVNLGTGNDYVRMFNCDAGSTRLFGGDGVDTFQYFSNAFGPLTTTGFEHYVNSQ